MDARLLTQFGIGDVIHVEGEEVLAPPGRKADSGILFPHDPNELPKRWEQARAKALTTFHLPFTTFTLSPKTEGIVWSDIVQAAPFSSFCIEESGRLHLDNIKTFSAAKKAEMIRKGFARPDGWIYSHEILTFRVIEAEEGANLVEAYSHIRYENGYVGWGPKVYDNGLAPDKQIDTLLESYLRLYMLFRDRKHRFLEQPVTRQVRRAMGVAKDYREYVVIPREHVRYRDALSRADMIRRMRQLHAVRGHYRSEHLRDLGDGKVSVVAGSWVRPHVRGEGTALQVRDYRLPTVESP